MLYINSFWTIDNCSEPIGGFYSRAFMSILRDRTVDVLLQVSKKSRNSQTRDKRFQTTATKVQNISRGVHYLN